MKKKLQKPELVSPAGDWPSLLAAAESGADSVYFGIKGFNMRHGADNFDMLQIKKIMSYLHSRKMKGYLALNTIVMDSELSKVKKILHAAKRGGVDAVIICDMAALDIAKKLKLKIHLSTQASVSNVAAAKYYARLGVKRIVLARECTLVHIRKIARELKKDKVSCDIETFIHGAMCVSISGRCFLSHDAFEKSANRGECLQPCRREFRIQDTDKESKYIIGKDYILSPKDLCTIDFIDKLIECGISAFKIEGRMRSCEYVKVVTRAYRQALDAFFDGGLTSHIKQKLQDEVSTVYNRGFSSGFYLGRPIDANSRKLHHTHEKIFLGEVRRFYKKIQVADIQIRTTALNYGDTILFIGKSTPAAFAQVAEMQRDHKPVKQAKKGEAVGVKLPFIVRPKDKVFLWRKRA